MYADSEKLDETQRNREAKHFPKTLTEMHSTTLSDTQINWPFNSAKPLPGKIISYGALSSLEKEQFLFFTVFTRKELFCFEEEKAGKKSHLPALQHSSRFASRPEALAILGRIEKAINHYPVVSTILVHRLNPVCVMTIGITT
jgi:hypothetical protein